MKTFELDIINIEDRLKNRIIHGANLENTILVNYSTNKLKQAELYNKVVEEALDFLVGKDGRKHPIQLFELIKESDFNTRYMEIITWLDHVVNKNIGVIYQEVYVSKKEGSKITFTIVS